jgi:hypothetical protein
MSTTKKIHAGKKEEEKSNTLAMILVLAAMAVMFVAIVFAFI